MPGIVANQQDSSKEVEVVSDCRTEIRTEQKAEEDAITVTSSPSPSPMENGKPVTAWQSSTSDSGS